MQTQSYAIALLVVLLATVLNGWSVWTPTWIETRTPPSSPLHYTVQYGLTLRCQRRNSNGEDYHPTPSESDWHCRSFPLGEKDCHHDRHFCTAWRGASYAAQLGFAFHVVALLALVLILALDGRQRKQSGWRVVAATLTLAATLTAVCVAVVANLLDGDERFYAGSKLGSAFYVATSSLGLVLLTVVALVVGGIQSSRNPAGAMGDGYLPVQ